MAIKLFIFSQELAISSGKESLTVSIIQSAARNKFNMLQPALKAFKEKDKKALSHFEDAYPSYLEHLMQNEPNKSEIVGKIVDEPEIKINLTSNRSDLTSYTQQNSPQENKDAVETFFNERTKRPKKTKKTVVSKGVLPEVLLSVEKDIDDAVYKSLKDKGFIKSDFDSDEESNTGKEAKK